MSRHELVPDSSIGDQPLRISIDQAMALAIEFLMHGQVIDAEAVCGKVLELSPRHPDALHYSGVLAHKRGRTVEGIALVRQSLELAPDQADWHSNLGILLQANGDLEEAMSEFEVAVALQPLHANAHNNLGVLRRVFGRNMEAEESYRAAIRLDAEHADAYRNLAILLDLTGRTYDALVVYCKAITLKPDNVEARRLLAMAYCTVDQRDKAISVCEEWVREQPDNPIARHTLAACSGRDVPSRASDGFIRRSFDSFATTFEAKLAKLHYKAPELVAGALADTGLSPARALNVLDAGCGTGLCGPYLAPYARRLVGVDLSAGMLNHAREKQLYDELVERELTGFLQEHSGEFDAIVSADTLVYFGDLEEFAFAASSALSPSGWLIFTVEEADPGVEGFQLEVHGRYNHAAGYVERTLASAGLRPDIERATLRNESGLPVAGLVIRATKPAGDDHA